MDRRGSGPCRSASPRPRKSHVASGPSLPDWTADPREPPTRCSMAKPNTGTDRQSTLAGREATCPASGLGPGQVSCRKTQETRDGVTPQAPSSEPLGHVTCLSLSGRDHHRSRTVHPTPHRETLPPACPPQPPSSPAQGPSTHSRGLLGTPGTVSDSPASLRILVFCLWSCSLLFGGKL